jgi:SAM-dependent methyltransferase
VILYPDDESLLLNPSRKGRLIHYRNTIEVYSKPDYAERYFEVWKDDIPISKIDRFLSLLPLGSKILDSGCGPGHHTNYIRRCGYDVCGIDISNAALSLAEKNFCHISFLNINMLKTGFLNNTFDGIWSCASAVHLPLFMFQKQLNEFFRTLKLYGILSLTISAGKDEHISPDGRYFYSFINELEIEQYLIASGFVILDNKVEILAKTTVNNKMIIGRWITVLARKCGSEVIDSI